MTISNTTFLTFILFTNFVFGQKINGVVVSPKGDSIAFVNIFTVGGEKQSLATTDFDGHFSLAVLNENRQIYAMYFDCSSDTILATPSRTKDLKLTIKINTICASKLEVTNCRNDFFFKGAYYVNLTDISNNELKIVTYEEILTKEQYSPYDYERIEKNKKYRADNGEIFTGEELILKKHLPLKLWNGANFRAVDEEPRVKLTPQQD
ncbi:MAG: hypothetical protein V4511_15645 [Bacteroidota bacterium]